MCGTNDINAGDVRNRATDGDWMMATPDEDQEATNEPEIADATNEPEIADEEAEIELELWQRFVIRLDREEIDFTNRELALFVQWAFPQGQQADVGRSTDLMHLFRFVWPYHR